MMWVVKWTESQVRITDGASQVDGRVLGGPGVSCGSVEMWYEVTEAYGIVTVYLTHQLKQNCPGSPTAHEVLPV